MRRRVLAWAVPAAAIIALVVWDLAPRIMPLRVDVALYRQGLGPLETVTAVSSIRSGDRLYLEIEGSRPMYVYAVNEDELGQVFALFPAESGPRNPLPPRVRHRLPSGASGQPSSWLITNSAGAETILVLASAEPREDIESELQRYPRPLEGQGKQRGLGRVEPEPGGGTATRRLEQLASLGRHMRIWRIQVRIVGE